MRENLPLGTTLAQVSGPATLPCPECNGHGEVLTEDFSAMALTPSTCPRCSGTGEITEAEAVEAGEAGDPTSKD